ncbi:MAG: peptidase dimerization domain-containing protein [Enterocloster sp.]
MYSGLHNRITTPSETAPRVLSVCTIHSGPQDKNIIPDCCTMTGTLRADKLEVWNRWRTIIARIARSSCHKRSLCWVTTGHGRAGYQFP